MAYTITVEPAHQREELIAEQTRDAKTEAFYDFQNRPTDLAIVYLPIGLLIYRMANYRTRTMQQAYLRRQGLPSDYFSAGEENEAAQRHQHDFLVKYAQEGRKGSITPIVEVLEKEGQTFPILITSRGVVVNGNRRLAGMRFLLDKDPKQFAKFSHVKCQVLPATATAQEIRELEVRLQMKQRTELEYEWINECIAIKELRDSGMDVRALASIMSKKKGDIESAINALTEADLYLSEWLGTPQDYDAIEDAKQIFYDMGDNLSAKVGEIQEVSRRIAWLLVDRRRTLGRRVYEFKPMFGQKADEVAAKLGDRFGVEVESGGVAEEDSDDFDIDLGADGGSLRPLINLLDDPTRREDVTRELVEVCQSIVESENDKARGQQPLNQIQKANGLLTEVDMTKAESKTLDAIDKQLGAIQGHVERLRAYVDRQRARPATSEA